MNRRTWMPVVAVGLFMLSLALSALAYPPAVGILAKNRSCLSCHPANGPWADEARTIVDIRDMATGTSMRGPDGAFLIEVTRGQLRTVHTIIGRSADDTAPAPLRNAWLYLDTTQLATATLSKFAPGWEVNLPMACRLVGDPVAGLEGAHVTSLPMTIRPTDAARDAEVELQIMLTGGESVKGKPAEGLLSNYLVRKVRLVVTEP